MRYYISLVSIAISSLYGAQQNLQTTLALPEHSSPMFRAERCDCVLSTEEDIRYTGGSIAAGAIVAAVCFGNPIQPPANVIICCCGYAGLSIYACAKTLAKRKCTLYCYWPSCCNTESAEQPLPEAPIIPTLITDQQEISAANN